MATAEDYEILSTAKFLDARNAMLRNEYTRLVQEAQNSGKVHHQAIYNALGQRYGISSEHARRIANYAGYRG